MKKKKRWKGRLLSFLLAIAMVMTSLNLPGLEMNVYAEEDSPDEEWNTPEEWYNSLDEETRQAVNACEEAMQRFVARAGELIDLTMSREAISTWLADFDDGPAWKYRNLTSEQYAELYQLRQDATAKHNAIGPSGREGRRIRNEFGEYYRPELYQNYSKVSITSETRWVASKPSFDENGNQVYPQILAKTEALIIKVKEYCFPSPNYNYRSFNWQTKENYAQKFIDSANLSDERWNEIVELLNEVNSLYVLLNDYDKNLRTNEGIYGKGYSGYYIMPDNSTQIKFEETFKKMLEAYNQVKDTRKTKPTTPPQVILTGENNNGATMEYGDTVDLQITMPNTIVVDEGTSLSNYQSKYVYDSENGFHSENGNLSACFEKNGIPIKKMIVPQPTWSATEYVYKLDSSKILRNFSASIVKATENGVDSYDGKKWSAAEIDGQGDYGVIFSFATGGLTRRNVVINGTTYTIDNHRKDYYYVVVPVTIQFREVPRYSLTITNATTTTTMDENGCKVGETVKIKANAIPAGQRFKEWKITGEGVTLADANAAETSFVMPDHDVTIEAVFEDIIKEIKLVPSENKNEFTAEETSEFNSLSWYVKGTYYDGQTFKYNVSKNDLSGYNLDRAGAYSIAYNYDDSKNTQSSYHGGKKRITYDIRVLKRPVIDMYPGTKLYHQNPSYTGDDIELFRAGEVTGGKLQYSLNKDGDYTDKVSKVKKVGTYSLYYRVIGDKEEGYGDLLPSDSRKINGTVDQMIIDEIEWKPLVFTYDGENHIPVPSIPQKYLVAGETVSVTAPSASNSAKGTYEVSITTDALSGPDAGNYRIASSTRNATVSYRIEGADPQLAVSEVGQKTMSDDDFTLTVSKMSDGVLSYQSSDTSVLTVDADGKVHIVGTGSATIKISIAETSGYKADEKEIQITVVRSGGRITTKDNKIEYTVEYGDYLAIPYTKTNSTELNINNSNDEIARGYKYDYPVSDTVYVEAKKIGDATIRLSTAEDAAHGAASIVITIHVVRRKATVSADDITVTYGDSAKELTFQKSNVRNGETLTGIILSCSQNGEVGTYDIIASQEEGANPNYDLTFQNGTYKIEPKKIKVTSNNASLADSNPIIYDGTAKEPKIILKDGNKVIPETEYVLSYENNVNEGKATITVKDAADGNYVIEEGTLEFLIHYQDSWNKDVLRGVAKVQKLDPVSIQNNHDGTITISGLPEVADNSELGLHDVKFYVSTAKDATAEELNQSFGWKQTSMWESKLTVNSNGPRIDQDRTPITNGTYKIEDILNTYGQSALSGPYLYFQMTVQAGNDNTNWLYAMTENGCKIPTDVIVDHQNGDHLRHFWLTEDDDFTELNQALAVIPELYAYTSEFLGWKTGQKSEVKKDMTAKEILEKAQFSANGDKNYRVWVLGQYKTYHEHRFWENIVKDEKNNRLIAYCSNDSYLKDDCAFQTPVYTVVTNPLGDQYFPRSHGPKEEILENPYISLEVSGKVYDGEPVEPNVIESRYWKYASRDSIVSYGITKQMFDGKERDWFDTYNKVDAGTYTARLYTKQPKDRYNLEDPMYVEKKFEIRKRPVTVKAPEAADPIYYTKLDQELLKTIGSVENSIAKDGMTLEYKAVKLEDGSEKLIYDWTESIPKASELGKYKIYYRIKNAESYAVNYEIQTEDSDGSSFVTTEIKYYETDAVATLSGRKVGNWYTSAVNVNAPEGFHIKNANDPKAVYAYAFTVTGNGSHVTEYNMVQNGTGYIVRPKKTEEYWIDTTAPIGNILIQKNDIKAFFHTLLEKVNFEYFFKKTVDVTIEGTDEVSGIASIAYQKAAKEEDFKPDGSWTDGSKFSVEDDEKFIVYARIMDHAGHETIINSNGVVVYTDATAEDTVEFTKMSGMDVPTRISIENNTIKSISLTGTVSGQTVEKNLVLDQDYSVQDNKIVLLKDGFLKTEAAGSYEIRVTYHPYGEIFDKGEDAAESTIYLTIKKANASILLKEKTYEKTYGDDEFSAAATGKVGESDITYESENPKVATIDQTGKVTIHEVGETTIKLSMEESANYYAASETVMVKVKAKEVILQAADLTIAGDGSFVYDGTEQKPAVTVMDGEKEIPASEYTVSYKNNINASEDTKEAEKKPVVIITDNDGGNYVVTGSKTFEIAKANPELSVSEVEDKTYGDEAFKLTVTKTGESALTFASSDEKVLTVDETGKVTLVGAGKAIVAVSLAESENYKAVAKEVIVKVLPKAITVTAEDKSKTYGDQDEKLTYTAAGLVGEDALEKIILSRKEGEDVGAYLITVDQEDSANPNYAITFTNGTYTIVPKDITGAAVELDGTLTYNGKEQTQNVKSVVIDGLEATFDVTENKVTKAGEYVLKITGNGNYSGTIEQKFVVEKIPGTVSFEVNADDAAPHTEIGNSEQEMIAMLASEEELAAIEDGDSLKIWVEITDASATISEAAKNLIQNAASEYQVGAYLDISLYEKMATADHATQITGTNQPITVRVTIPENLRTSDPKVKRSFIVVRVHDGAAEVLPTICENNTLIFMTDKFSDYAILYQDQKVEEPSKDEPVVEDPNKGKDEPVVEDPNKDKPAVEEPTTEDPNKGKDEPVVEDPSKDKPAVEEPTTEDPNKDKPAVEEPTTEDPNKGKDEPVVEDPNKDKPAVEEPTTEDPKKDKPAVEDPKPEEPAKDQPATEDPKKDKPAVEEPTTEDPKKDPGKSGSDSKSGSDNKKRGFSWFTNRNGNGNSGSGSTKVTGSTKAAGSTKAKTPRTGDVDLLQWWILLLLGFVSMTGAAIYRRKSKKTK